MKNLAAALAAAKVACPPVPLNGYNSHDNYHYARADDVVATATEPLANEGLVVVPLGAELVNVPHWMNSKRQWVEVSSLCLKRHFRLIHAESGEHIDGAGIWPLVPRANDVGKATGVAETEAYAYYLKTLLDMQRGDDMNRPTGAPQGDPTASALPRLSAQGARWVAQVRAIDSAEKFAQADKAVSGLFDKREAGGDAWAKTGLTDGDLDTIAQELEAKR